MDFASIDDLVVGYNRSAGPGNDVVEEKLDAFDLNRLRSIYSRVTGKCPDLLKRHHLSQEILKAYTSWQTERNHHNVSQFGIGSEVVKLASLLSYAEAGSWTTKSFRLGEQIDADDDGWLLFRCRDRDQFYHKCGEELLYRSHSFSNITQDHPALLKAGNYTRLLDIYFKQFYGNYIEEYRDFLTLITLGLNQFRYQIVKIILDDNSVKITYDQKITNMGYFHLQLPDIQTQEGGLPREGVMGDRVGPPTQVVLCESETLHYSDNDNGSLTTEGMASLLNKQTDLKYSDVWYYHPALHFRFTPIDPKHEESLMKEEIFSSLLL